METTKIIEMPNQNNDNWAMMQAMNNNNWNNNPFMYLIWLWFMRGMGNGYENSPQIAALQNQMNDKTTSDLLMQAINGNSAALHEFSTRTGVGLNDIEAGICSVQNAIGSQGCANQLATERQTNILNQGIAGLNTSLDRNAAIIENMTQTQTCSLQNTIKDTSNANTRAVLDKLDTMVTAGMQDKINTLTAELASANARAERAAELAPIVAQLNEIKNAQPSTTTIQYPQLTAVPTPALYGATPYINGYWG